MNPQSARGARIIFPTAPAPDTVAVEIIPAKDGNAVPVITVSGRQYPLHSRFDPVREAERFIAEIKEWEFDIYIVYGFGFGYHVEEILTRAASDSLILVVERFAGVLRAALESRPDAAVFADPRVVILADPDQDALEESLRGHASARVTFIFHRGSAQISAEYYQSINNLARSFFASKDVNIATLSKFEKLWASNSSRNITRMLSYPGVEDFYGAFADAEALVVCAGPSLTESIPLIRTRAKHALVIAVDTAYRILSHYGIEPDFILCVDPQIINARYFEGARPNRGILVCDPTSHPSVFSLYPGRICVSGAPFANLRWVEEITGSKGEIAHGGSVSTNAYDFAKRLGVRNVIMVGQDLAFTRGLAHARGSYLDEQIYLRRNRFSSEHDFNRRQMTALPKVWVDAIGGGTVHTNQKMIIFMEWFQKRNDPSLWNASAGGALLKGMQHGIPDAFAPAEDVHARVDALYAAASRRTHADHERVFSAAAEKLERIMNELESYTERVASAVRTSDELITAIRLADGGKVRSLVKKLDAADEYLESRKQVMEITGISMQRVIHTVLEGYDDHADSNETPELAVARRSRFLYGAMHENGAFNLRLIRKMRTMLSCASEIRLHE